VQCLQSWLPGFVRVITAARKIDTLIGITTAGKWDDEEVIQGVLEPLGEAAAYGDYTNIPLSSWNVNFERRTVLRFEKGIKVGLLEDARSARVRINNAAEKRSAAALSLDIVRNRVGFYGYNGGANRTYGFLNDPALPAYISAGATGTGSSTLWSLKTFLNITADLRGMFARLQAASQDFRLRYQRARLAAPKLPEMPRRIRSRTQPRERWRERRLPVCRFRGRRRQ